MNQHWVTGKKKKIALGLFQRCESEEKKKGKWSQKSLAFRETQESVSIDSDLYFFFNIFIGV